MLALAGAPLGLEIRAADPQPDACAKAVTPTLTAQLEAPETFEWLESSQAVTYESENVPPEVVRALRERTTVDPGPRALETASDRLREKECFRTLGIGTNRFHPVSGPDDFAGVQRDVGFPCVLKIRSEGYDGKGQRVVRAFEDLERSWNELGRRPALAEAWVSFEREVSIIAVRGRHGELRFYPLVENEHVDGILRTSRVRPKDPGQAQAEDHARKLIEHLDYVGVMVLELFALPDGNLWANEMAPRVHNSGHWTIEGATTSQFENHLRAILGWSLGDTSVRRPCAMVNLLGTVGDVAPMLQIPGVHVHDYGKQPRAGRKVGHVTIEASDDVELERRLQALHVLLDARPDAP